MRKKFLKFSKLSSRGRRNFRDFRKLCKLRSIVLKEQREKIQVQHQHPLLLKLFAENKAARHGAGAIQDYLLKTLLQSSFSVTAADELDGSSTLADTLNPHILSRLAFFSFLLLGKKWWVTGRPETMCPGTNFLGPLIPKLIVPGDTMSQH